MSRAKGKESRIYVQYPSSNWELISCEMSHDFQEDTEMVGTTTRDNNGWKTHLPTVQSFTLSFTAMIEKDEMGVDGKVSYIHFVNMKRTAFRVKFRREIQYQGESKFFRDEGFAYITSLGAAAEVDGFVIFDVSLIGDGEPTWSVETPSSPPFP